MENTQDQEPDEPETRLPCNQSSETVESLRALHSLCLRNLANKHDIPDRYVALIQQSGSSASAPALLAQVNQDGQSADPDTRRDALVAAYVLVPELGGSTVDALDEHQSHDPNWRNRSGTAQNYLHECLDPLTKLYLKIVEQGIHTPTIGYVKATLHNWQINQARRNSWIEQFHEGYWTQWDIEDENQANLLQDSTELEELKKELVPTYLSEEQFSLYLALKVDNFTSKEVAAHLGTTPDAINQKTYTSTMREAWRRDMCFLNKLIYGWYYRQEPISFDDHAPWFTERVRSALRPTAGVCRRLPVPSPETPLMPVPLLLPFTTGDGHRLPRLYLFVANRDFVSQSKYLATAESLLRHYIGKFVVKTTNVTPTTFKLSEILRVRKIHPTGISLLDTIFQKAAQYAATPNDHPPIISLCISCSSQTELRGFQDTMTTCAAGYTPHAGAAAKAYLQAAVLSRAVPPSLKGVMPDLVPPCTMCPRPHLPALDHPGIACI